MRITKEEMEELLDEGYGFTEIADIKKVDPSYISKLAKRWGLQAPPPGRRPGSIQTEETKRKIGESVRRKHEENAL